MERLGSSQAGSPQVPTSQASGIEGRIQEIASGSIPSSPEYPQGSQGDPFVAAVREGDILQVNELMLQQIDPFGTDRGQTALEAAQGSCALWHAVQGYQRCYREQHNG